ncbi:hypothetical protein BMS3Bbin02_02068 [bacterium BMS3Bbin02]|nr:hypothetical protein BMS3Bbin02_02068 [bacterium BMS3Bbin02]
MLKRVLAVAAFSLVVAACGEMGVLDGAEDLSDEFIYGGLSTTTTTTIAIVVTEGEVVLASSESANWVNDALPDQASGVEQVVISRTWQRGDGERFVQASRAEIAIALPGILFPAVVPEDVRWITSQLVFDVASATLDADVSAAFGLWADQPYSSDESRRAVLRVGSAAGTTLVEGEIRPELRAEGFVMSWVAGNYRYELFCPTPLSEAACTSVAESAAPLAAQLP